MKTEIDAKVNAKVRTNIKNSAKKQMIRVFKSQYIKVHECKCKQREEA
jgi:hypothetical protein